MNRQGLSIKIIVFVILASLVASALMCLVFVIFAIPIFKAAGVEDLFSSGPKDSWKSFTSPLTPEQTAVLCKNFNLNKEIVCNKPNVYGPEFYPYIIDAFHPTEFARFGDNTKPADYSEVEEKLGQFKTKCYPGVTGSSTFQLFVCRYDLRGDGVYALVISFEEPERTVFTIATPLKDDW